MIAYKLYRKELEQLCRSYGFATTEQEATSKCPNLYTPFSSCELRTVVQYRRKLKPLLELYYLKQDRKKIDFIKKQLSFLKEVENLMIKYIRQENRNYFESWDQPLNEGIKEKVKNLFAGLRSKLNKAVMIAGMIAAVVNPSYAEGKNVETQTAPTAIVRTDERQQKPTDKYEIRLLEASKEFKEEADELREIMKYYDNIYKKNIGRVQQDWFRKHIYDYETFDFNKYESIITDLFPGVLLEHPDEFNLEYKARCIENAIKNLKEVKKMVKEDGEKMIKGITLNQDI